MNFSNLELEGEPLPIVVLFSAGGKDPNYSNLNFLSKIFFGNSDLFDISMLKISSSLDKKSPILKEIKESVDNQLEKSKSKGFALIHINISERPEPLSISYFSNYGDSAFANVVKCMIEEVKLDIEERFDLKSPILKKFDDPSRAHFTIEVNISVKEIDKYAIKDSNNETLLQKFMRFTVYGIAGVVAGNE